MHSNLDFSSCHIVVIGDAMLDRYWHGDTARISPEAPVPVVKIETEEERVGGAANVALNVRALGAACTLLSAVAEDEAGQKLQAMLHHHHVACQVIAPQSAKTTLKLRIIGRQQQLIRLDFEDQQPIAAEKILPLLTAIADKINVIILSDYAKGMLAHPQPLIAFAKSRGIKVIIDPKNRDLNVYRGASILTPNLAEFEMAVGHCANVTELEQKGRRLVKDLGLDALLITRGSQGMSIISANGAPIHLPTQAREVFDVTGAGDTVTAVLATALAATLSLEQAANLANCAAGLAVAKLGTAAITMAELKQALGLGQQASQPGILTVPSLQAEILQRKQRGETIVLTNGCFDILHAGHVYYLQEARSKGDCLIIAVNDDASVKRLKGNSRPVNSLEQRMQVLAALGCVDYVIAFSEDTPQKLIAALLPDVLVKGGDYLPHQIAGAEEVINNGGRVEILSFVPGCSTTQTIARLQATTDNSLESSI